MDVKYFLVACLLFLVTITSRFILVISNYNHGGDNKYVNNTFNRENNVYDRDMKRFDTVHKVVIYNASEKLNFEDRMKIIEERLNFIFQQKNMSSGVDLGTNIGLSSDVQIINPLKSIRDYYKKYSNDDTLNDNNSYKTSRNNVRILNDNNSTETNFTSTNNVSNENNIENAKTIYSNTLNDNNSTETNFSGKNNVSNENNTENAITVYSNTLNDNNSDKNNVSNDNNSENAKTTNNTSNDNDNSNKNNVLHDNDTENTLKIYSNTLNIYNNSNNNHVTNNNEKVLTINGNLITDNKNTLVKKTKKKENNYYKSIKSNRTLMTKNTIPVLSELDDPELNHLIYNYQLINNKDILNPNNCQNQTLAKQKLIEKAYQNLDHFEHVYNNTCSNFHEYIDKRTWRAFDNCRFPYNVNYYKKIYKYFKTLMIMIKIYECVGESHFECIDSVETIVQAHGRCFCKRTSGIKNEDGRMGHCCGNLAVEKLKEEFLNDYHNAAFDFDSDYYSECYNKKNDTIE